MWGMALLFPTVVSQQQHFSDITNPRGKTWHWDILSPPEISTLFFALFVLAELKSWFVGTYSVAPLHLLYCAVCFKEPFSSFYVFFVIRRDLLLYLNTSRNSRDTKVMWYEFLYFFSIHKIYQRKEQHWNVFCFETMCTEISVPP